MRRLATGQAATVAGDSWWAPAPYSRLCGSYAPMADAASWLCEGVTMVE